MFLINKSLKTFQEKYPASRSSTPRRAMAAPACRACRGHPGAGRRRCRSSTAPPTICPSAPTPTARSVVEKYWKLDPGLGIGPANVMGVAGRARCAGQSLPGHAGPGSRAAGRRGGGLAACPGSPTTGVRMAMGANVMWAPRPTRRRLGLYRGQPAGLRGICGPHRAQGGRPGDHLPGQPHRPDHSAWSARPPWPGACRLGWPSCCSTGCTTTSPMSSPSI